MATTKKPAVNLPPKKPETKDTRTPIRPQPAPSRPIINSHSNPAASLLYHLLTNSRGHAAGPLPGFNSFLSHGGHGVSSSDSDEVLASPLKRTVRNRWNIGLFSSEDSSDES